VILIGKDFWSPMVSWLKKSMLRDGHRKIDAQDLGLFRVIDDLDEAVGIIEEARAMEQLRQAEPIIAGLHRPTGEGTVMGQPPKPYSNIPPTPQDDAM
jgi:hypothetical protein